VTVIRHLKRKFGIAAPRVAVRTHAPLESYVGDTRTLAGATGSEVGDLFNMDVSL